MSNDDRVSIPGHVRGAPVPLDRCGLALACDLLGDRWTMLILREAFYGVSRFGDLRADLGIPRGVLSLRLARLMEEGILEKHPYREGRARLRHEYRLTRRGQELGPTPIALMQWGDRHIQGRPSPLKLFDRQTRETLTVALVTANGRLVAPEYVSAEIVED